MGLGAEAYIALRYLRSKRRSRLLSLISVLAVGGVGLGVAALIVVLAVLDGFETNFKEKLLGLQAHVTVYKPASNIADWDQAVAAIRRVPGVASVQPIAMGQVMAASAEGATGVILMGIDPGLAAESGFFDPMNLSPHGLENLTRRPMASPYPVPGDFLAGDSWLDQGARGVPAPEELEILNFPYPQEIPDAPRDGTGLDGGADLPGEGGDTEPLDPDGAAGDVSEAPSAPSAGSETADAGSGEPGAGADADGSGPETAEAGPGSVETGSGADAGGSGPETAEAAPGSREPGSGADAGGSGPETAEAAPGSREPGSGAMTDGTGAGESGPETVGTGAAKSGSETVGTGADESGSETEDAGTATDGGAPRAGGAGGFVSTAEAAASSGASGDVTSRTAEVTADALSQEDLPEDYRVTPAMEAYGVAGGSPDEPAAGAPGTERPPERGILIGSELSMLVGQGALGEVNVISPFGRVTPIGRRMPLSAIFRVAGVFRTNLFDYDSRVAYTTIRDAQEILGMDDTVSAIEIMCDDIYQAAEVRQLVLRALGPDFWGRDWMQMNMSLFSALKLEQTAMFVILTLIILVAAFNIASTLVMMVTEKTRDIAILKAMGATGGQVRRIFTIQGLAVGGAGTLGGFVVGMALCFLLGRYEFISLPPEVYLMSTLPVEIRPLQIAAIIAVSMAISFLATLYPSSQAAKLDPVEAIRYE
jgi:ABC-type lipoprotein release transport system permease subunit